MHEMTNNLGHAQHLLHRIHKPRWVVREVTLTPDELSQRLTAALPRHLRRPQVMNAEPGSAYSGSIDNGRFSIRMHTRSRNSFATSLQGTIRATPRGSELRGEFRMNGFQTVFVPFWFTGAVLLSVVVLATTANSLISGTAGLGFDTLFALVVAIGLPAGGVGVFEYLRSVDAESQLDTIACLDSILGDSVYRKRDWRDDTRS